MTISKEVTRERKAWSIPTKEDKIEIKGEETERLIRDRIKMAVRLARKFGSSTKVELGMIRGEVATLVSRKRRKDNPGIVETKWTEAENFQKRLNGVMGVSEPFPSLAIGTISGVREVFPSLQLTKEELTEKEFKEEGHRVLLVRSTYVPLYSGQETSTNWSVVAWRRPKRFQFLRDLFR